MGTSGWEDMAVTPQAGPAADGSMRFTATIADHWMLLVVPQGGAVAAVAARAMGATLDDPGQTLRSLTAVFAGQVATGPVEIDVTVLRRGRSMSQLSATVRNPGAKAGLTAVAVFGAPRRGFEFTDLVFPEVEPAEVLRGYRDPLPDGVEFEFDRPPMPFWEQIVECRPATGRPPWEPFEEGPAEIVYWYRLDDAAAARRRHPRPGRGHRPLRHHAGSGVPADRPRRGQLVRTERRLHHPPARPGPSRVAARPQPGPPRR